MKKISFTTRSLINDEEIIGPIALDNKYLLLSHFVGTQFVWKEVIGDLEKVLNEEKTFADIQNPNVIWDFAGGDGEFEYNKDTAYFYSESNPSLNLEMPLKEVIELLKEWKAFIEFK